MLILLRRGGALLASWFAAVFVTKKRLIMLCRAIMLLAMVGIVGIANIWGNDVDELLPSAGLNNDRNTNNNADDWQAFREDYYQRYQRHPPDSLQTWLLFAQKHRCATMDMYEAITQDLAPYFKSKRSPDTRSPSTTRKNWTDYEAGALNHTRNFAVFTLDQGELIIQAWHSDRTDKTKRLALWLFQPLAQHRPALASMTWVFNLHDIPVLPVHAHQAGLSLPLFSFCQKSYFNDDAIDFYENHTAVTGNTTAHHIFDLTKTTARSHDIRIPYIYSLRPRCDPDQYPEWAELPAWPKYDPGPAFQDRQTTLIWRGSTTGRTARFRLVGAFGQDVPNNFSVSPGVEVDVAFTKVVQSANATGYRMAPRLTYEDMQQYKYVIDVDGNAFTERFAGLLLSGSLVFKSTQYREWFTERVQPWVDYIPVRYDLSDLPERLAWAHAHPDRAAQIVAHGQKTARQYLRPIDAQCYTYRLLLEYGAMLEEEGW